MGTLISQPSSQQLQSRQRQHGRTGATWQFVRHYIEMLAAMLVGMAGFGVASAVFDLPEGTAAELAQMAVWMTVPMVAWMRIRGHGWRATNEMAAAMLLPAAAALALLGSGTVTDPDALLMLEHTAMFPAMLVAMLLRRQEYTTHHPAPASQVTA